MNKVLFLQVGSIVLMTIAFFILITNIDIKQIYQKIKKEEEKRKELKKEQVKESNYGESILEKIELMIQRSNIRLYISFYSVWMHLTICLFSMFLASSWMIKYMNLWISLIFGLVGFVVPFLFLQIFSDIMQYRIQKYSVDFLIMFKNFLISSKSENEFEAFEKTTEFAIEPLKSFIENLTYEYKSKINPIQCLDNFKNKLQSNELRIYIENLKLCYIHGGDKVALTDEYVAEIGQINEIEDHEDAEDKMFHVGLYVLLMINFSVIYYIIHSAFKRSVLDTLWGQIAFVLDILCSLYIMYLTMERGED